METASPGDGPGGLTSKRLSSLRTVYQHDAVPPADRGGVAAPVRAFSPQGVLPKTRTRGG